MTGSDDSAPALEYHGGIAGALVAFAVFLGGVAWLGLSGAPDERGFWPVLLLALAVSLLFARDRARCAEAMIAGMSRPIVMLMVMAWLLAGVLGTLLGASGLVQALVHLAQAGGVTGAGFTVAAFVVCCLVSTATGTSLGTLLVCGPLLYPAGGRLGAAPAALAGAILAGATFGDSISPISDTTIASATSQNADLGGTVRSRLKYALPAALVALIVCLVAGGGAVAADRPVALEARPASLMMLAVPVVVVGLLLARRHLIEGLLAGIALAIVIGVAAGLIRPAQLLFIDRAAFGARGLIITGMERGVGASVFTFLLMGLVATLEGAGVVARVVRFAERRVHSPRGAEAWIVAALSAAVLLTTHSIVAILTVGPFAKETGSRFGLSAYRRANLLDVTACTYPFLLPFCIPTIIAASTTVSGAEFGLPRISALTVGMWNGYSWGLLAMVLIAVATGYGRGEGNGT